MATTRGSAARAEGAAIEPAAAGPIAVRGAPAAEADAPPGPKPPRPLSGKELAVLHWLARGYTTDEAAELLFVSPHTVRTHVKNGMRKLGAKTRAHAVAIALTKGAIEVEPPEPAAPAAEIP
jgi:DNA-binding CsgD family transcriptional regulator